MSGMADWQAKISIDIDDLKKRIKVAEGELDKVTKEDRKIKLDFDTKTLESAIQKLDKMLDSLGKGTGDFKQFENLSKELSAITSEVKDFSKAFGKLDDSGAKTLLSSIQNIDRSLSNLNQHILNVNKNIGNMGNNTSGTVKQVENIGNAAADAVKQVDKLADAQSKLGNKTNISNGMKDAFPNANTKLDEVVTSAKDLDKTFEQVDIPTDSFDKVLEKLDRTKSELVDIVKITKQSVSDADGKFHDSYTLKDSRGSTETYGVSSKTDKGQILRQNIVGYDVKKDTVDNSKELLAIEKQLQKEIEASDKANQKKFQDFQKEQANYEESVNKVNSTIQKTDEILDTLPLHDKLDGQFLDMIDSVDNLNSKLKSGELTLSEYKNEVKSVTSEYSKMVSIQQKRDVEEYNANAKANLENAKNIQAEWDKNIKAIQDYMDAVTKLNNLKAKDKGTGSEANQIELQTQNVEKLKQIAFEARQNLSSMQAENPDIIAWKQWVDTMELFNQASKGSAESAAKLKDVLNNIKVPSLDKYENKLSSYQTKKAGYDATIARFNDGGWTSNAYLENVQAVKNAVKEYEDLLKELKGKDASLVTNEDINKLDSYEKKIKDTIATVTNMSASEKGYNFVSGQKELDKIHKLLAENSKMSSEAKAKIRAYYAEIESGNPSMSLDRIHGEILKIYNAEVEAGRAGRTLWDTLKNSGFHQIAAQMAGMVGVYDVINVIKQTASIVTDLNTQITELAKVSEQTSKQIYSDFDSYADIAKEVRGTISDTIAATADWSKNGYSIPDAKQLAEISQLYKNVGDGIDIGTANESLISTLKGFQLEADQAEHIVDVFNEVSNNESISSGGIGEALQRSAASFNAASTSLEKSVSLVTATNSVLQDPEKVGNMWRTVSARLRGSETELKEMGEDTDGLVTSTSKLQALVKGITGFDIMKDKDTYKDIYDIVLGIGEKWQDLSDIDRASLLEALAGKQQSNALAAALSNIDILKKSYEEATNAEGSAREENEEYSKSIQASIDLAQAKLEQLASDTLNSNFLKGAIDAGGKLIDILDGIVKSGNAIPAIATAISAALSLKNIGKCYVSA